MEKKSDNFPPLINPQILRPKFIKYPFSGTASNLIDKFLVLGYDQKDIERTLLSDEPKPVIMKNNYLNYIDFHERPTITNEICFNYNKESQENDVILKLIFPNCPKLYFLEKKYIKEQKEQYDSNEETNNYTIIFSINPLDDLSNSKKSFNGLGYVFYIKKEHRDDNNEIDGLIYYPITYVILSEYPYFYHFNKICKNVYIQMKKKTDEIPIDIILYNAIKYCPSPININLNLSFGATLTSNIKPELTANDILNRLYSKNKFENLNGLPFIFFNQLSGYPIFDFNLSFIFNLLEPYDIIKVFIITFLEIDIIFISSVPEILNMVIYIFANLNYPFTEQIYYWHIVSVSADAFMNDNSSQFIGKTCSSIYGVCYDNQNLDSEKLIEKLSEKLAHPHYFLDIDSKSLSRLEGRNEEDKIYIKDLDDLLDYINLSIPEIDLQDANKEENIIDEEYKKNYFNDGINLYESINTLAIALNRRFRAVTNINYNEKNYRPTFFIPYENESEMDTLRENLQIQKAFYNFLVQIMSSIMREFPVETHEMNGEKASPIDDYFPLMINIKKKYEDEISSEKSLAYRAGLTVKKLFKETSKNSSFLFNFCTLHDCMDLSKIPYSFFSEYLYFSKISPNYNLNAIDIFLIIDQFYEKIKKLDFIEMIKEKQEEGKNDKFNLIKSINLDEKMNNVNKLKNISNFSYDKFESYYKDQLRAYINREQEDDKNIFVKEQGGSKQFKTYKRNNFYLSQRILDIYIYYLNNNFEQLKDIFKLTNCEYKMVEEPKNEIKIKNPKQNNNKDNKNASKDNLIQDFLIIEDPNEQLSPKEKEKKKKIMIQKKADAKLFGTYQLIEINDLIEKHLIKEKYFSSYEIMKFSLLSIIALTINLKNKQISNVEVIKILCDFCQITKSLVRKYMNIYLNIFTTMKLNNWLDKNICDECINSIIIYFKKTNTFPNEDTIRPIVKSEVHNYQNEILVEYKTLEKFKSTNKSVREKRAEFYKKLDRKKEEQLSDYIEKVFTGWYYTSKNKLASNIEYYAKKYSNLYYALTHKKGDFVPKTPLELYATTNELLLKFLSKFSIDDNEYVELGSIVLSLLYYFKMDFFLPKWIFKAGNINHEKVLEADIFLYNKVDREIIKQLVINIIYILLDLYEAILTNIKK